MRFNQFDSRTVKKHAVAHYSSIARIAELESALRVCRDTLSINFAETRTIEGRRSTIAVNTANAALRD